PLLGWLSSEGGSSPTQAWLNWLDPFAALQSILEPGFVAKTPIAPAYGFAGIMAVVSVLLNVWAIVRLRVWNPSGEPIMQREQPVEEQEEVDRTKAHAAPGPVRAVWANPILWREIRTNAYGRWPFLVKVAYLIAFCLIGYYALEPTWTSEGRTSFFAARGLVPAGILSLLLVSVQAATAITSE